MSLSALPTTNLFANINGRFRLWFTELFPYVTYFHAIYYIRSYLSFKLVNTIHLCFTGRAFKLYNVFIESAQNFILLFDVIEHLRFVPQVKSTVSSLIY